MKQRKVSRKDSAIRATMDRRTFLKQAGGAAAWALLGPATRLLADTLSSADLVLKNGAIITMDDKLPLEEAMAVRGGRILAVGTNQQITAAISRNTRVVDLGGKCVSPGLIDAHSHAAPFGHMQLKFVLLRPPKVNSFATLNAELAKAAQAKPAGVWIVGRGFDTFKEGRFPRRQELDEATPNHPVLIIHWGGQFGVANTLALKKANLLRADVQDPYGGKFLRDKAGVPDGVLIHYPAIYAVHQPEISEEEQVECAAWGVKQFASCGVTCIHDNFANPQTNRAYIRLERAGTLPCRLRLYPYVKNLQHCQMTLENMRRYNGPLVRIQGIKLAVDGYALMYDIPPQHRHLAIPMHPQPLFEQIIAAIHKAGMQVDVHAVGDKGVDWTLEAFAKAAGSVSACRERRHRIEHYAFRKPDSIRRTAELNVPVCVQPLFVEIKADDFLEKLGGQHMQSVQTICPLRTFLREGVHLAFGADVPAFPSHLPMDSIRCAMDRVTQSGRKLDPDEKLSFMEALRIHTLGSAYAAFDEKELGSLEPGKLADFVIWNRDLRQVRTGKDALALQPAATYLGGKVVYEAA
jgi:predicted amidohydrolase YtcJ